MWISLSGGVVFARSSEVTLATTVGGKGNMVDGIGTDFPATITVTNVSGKTKNVNVNVRCTDEEGNVLYFDNVEKSIAKSSSEKLELTIPGVEKFGFYKLGVSATDIDTDKDFARDSYEFSVVNFPEDGVVNSEIGIINHVRHSGINDPLVNLEILSKAGFSGTRSEISWKLYETAKGKYELPAKYRQVMGAYANKGIKHLEILGYSNDIYGEQSPPSTDAQIEAYANYGVELAGDLREILGSENLEIEVWNEYNNSPTFNKDGQPASMYAKMLKATYPKLKAAYPDMQIWAMSTLGIGMDWTKPWARPFLSALGKRTSSSNTYFDGISVHPYSNKEAPEKSDIFYDVKSLKSLLNTYGYGDVPIRATEWGWPAAGGEYPDEMQQASYFVRANVLNDYHDAFSHIDWYSLSDQSNDDEAGSTFGIIGHYKDKVPYGAKPAFLAAANYNSIMTDAVYKGSLEIGEDVTAYKYTLRDGRDCVVGWKVSEGTENAGVDLGAKKATLVDMYGNESEITSAGGEFYCKYDESPVYIIGEFDKFDTISGTVPQSGVIYEFDHTTRTMSVYGSLSESLDEENMSIMVLPEGEDPENADFEKLLYIGDTVAHNGLFAVEFGVSEDTYGKFDLYIGRKASDRTNVDMGYISEGHFDLVCTLDVTSSDSTVSAAAYLENDSTASKKAIMFIVQYDENGKLLSAKSGKITVAAGTKPSLFSVTDTKLSGAKSTKAFIWDDMSSIKPIVPYAER